MQSCQQGQLFCAGLNLPIVIYWLEKPRGTHLGLRWALTGISPFRASVVIGPALVVLMMATTIRELGTNKKENQGLLLTNPEGYTVHLGPPSEVAAER